MRRALPLLCLITLFLAGCAIGRPQPVSRTGFAFDTVIQVTVYDPEAIRSGAAESALNDCMALASRYEALFSTTREDSDIYRLNHADGAAVRVDPETVLLLQTALSYADQTDDLFNPLIGALTSCWDFSATTDRHVPDAQRITEALLHVDPCCLTMDLSDQTAPVLCLSDPAARIDTGGIAKGYIADRMKETLVHQGINSALINLGGNVLAIGGRPDDAPFRIGIRQPFGTARETSDIISVNDRSVVTSGVYERYFEADGRRYHHILDPQTGYPAETGLYSVSILSDASVDGDALSTICLLLGAEKGMALIETIPDTEALFITDQLELLSTSGWPDSSN